MGSKPSAPKYNVQAAYTDYNVQDPYTEYNVNQMRAMAGETPNAMQVPVYDRQSAYDEQNRINQTAGSNLYANVNSPLGGYSVSVDPVTGQLTVNKSLSDTSTAAQQAQLNALNSYTGDPTQAANAYYNAQMQYLQPQFDRQIERTESSLTNRGLPLGSNAWNEAVDNVYNAQNRTLAALSDEALSKGQAYQSNILGQASMLGNQVVDPTMVGGQGATGLGDTYTNYYNSLANQASADYDNALLRYQNAYQDEANRYQNEMNAYNAAYNNNMNAYQNALNSYYNDVQNEQNRYQNELNKYQNAVQNYQTKLANYNSKWGSIGSTVGMLGGAALGTIIAPGVGTAIGASLGGSLGGGTAGAITGGGYSGNTGSSIASYIPYLMQNTGRSTLSSMPTAYGTAIDPMQVASANNMLIA